MKYATIEDLNRRRKSPIAEAEVEMCEALLEDAGVIIDAYNEEAAPEAKLLVACNMVIRALGTREDSQLPLGTTQGTMSALGYSQTFTIGGGTGELYLTRLEKRLLGSSGKVGFASPWREA